MNNYNIGPTDISDIAVIKKRWKDRRIVIVAKYFTVITGNKHFLKNLQLKFQTRVAIVN